MQLGLEREISDEEEELEEEENFEYQYETEEIEEIEDNENNNLLDENYPNEIMGADADTPFGLPNPLAQGQSRLTGGALIMGRNGGGNR